MFNDVRLKVMGENSISDYTIPVLYMSNYLNLSRFLSIVATLEQLTPQ